ncbi:MAG: hypothetical protein REI12_00500 [Pedobacter sp.]|nr:hypothetical protein [Pedobacter sp.]
MKNTLRTLLAAALLATAGAHAADPTPREVTVAKIEEFLGAAGLQSCRVEKLNPKVSSWHGTIVSVWVEMAPDCTKSNPDNPDVGHFHQFNNKADRDAMISRYRSSLPRGINLHAGIWPVGDFGAIALLGPNMNKYKDLIQAEFSKRLAAEKQKASGK